MTTLDLSQKDFPDTFCSEGDSLFEYARLQLYRFFSLALLNPNQSQWALLQKTDLLESIQASMDFLRETALPTVLAPGELSAKYLDLTDFRKFLQQPRIQLEQEYQSIFGLLPSSDCPPYETEYCPQTFSVYRSHQMADVAGFYRAFGLERSKEFSDRVDHLAMECEFMAWLIAKARFAEKEHEEEGALICREAQKKFFQAHLFWWTPAFASLLRKKIENIESLQEEPTPPRTYLSALSLILAAFIPIERHFFQIEPSFEKTTPSSSIEEQESASCENCTSAQSFEPISPEEEELR